MNKTFSFVVLITACTDFLPEGLVCASITKLEFRPEVDEYTNKGGEEFIFD